MSETSGDVVGKTKKGKRKASGATAGAPRAPKTNLIELEFGARVAVAAKAYFKPRKAAKAELMAALKAKSKVADPEVIAKIQRTIAKAQSKLAAATNSEAVIEKYRAPLLSITETLYGGIEDGQV